MIGVRVREDEERERSPTSPEMRDHRRSPRIAPRPAATGIDQHPAAAWRADRDGIPLPDIEQMDLGPRGLRCERVPLRQPDRDRARAEGEEDPAHRTPHPSGDERRDRRHADEPGGDGGRRDIDHRTGDRGRTRGDRIHKAQQRTRGVHGERGPEPIGEEHREEQGRL